MEARCKQGVFVGYDKYKFTALDQPKLVPAETSEHIEHDSNVNKENKNGDATQTASNTEHPNSRYPRRQHVLPKHLEDFDRGDSTKCTVDYCCRLTAIPQTHEEAVSCAEAPKWREAMEDEMKSLHNNNTFTVVPHDELFLDYT